MARCGHINRVTYGLKAAKTLGYVTALGVSTLISSLVLSSAATAQIININEKSALPTASATSERKSNAWSTKTLTKTPQSLNLDLTNLNADLDSEFESDARDEIAGISPVLKNAIFNLPSDTTSPLFKLDLSGSLCLDTAISCAHNDIRVIELGYEKNFAKDAFSGIDLALTPRASVQYFDDSSSALVGALFKIGDNLHVSEDGQNKNTWFVFAGADAQTLSLATDGQLGEYEGQFALQDNLIVGDAQAGVTYRLGDADVSLTYLKRQARAENYKFEEDAAALSLTWRR